MQFKIRMTKPQTKERLLQWIVVPALAAVLIGLAVLQYRWSGQLSEATRTQMQSTLQRSLMGFRQDFAKELGAVAVEIRTVVDGSSAIKPAELKEQFHHWQQTSAHPNLVSHIYLWQDPGKQQPLRFDPQSDQFERVPWPEEFDPMQKRLLEITAAFHPPTGEQDMPTMRREERRHSGFGPPHNFGGNRRMDGRSRNAGMHARLADAMIPWAIDQSVPALAYPVRRRGAPGGASPEVTWLIIQLNPSVMAKEIFPELAQKYFSSTSGMEYHLAVRGAGKDGQSVLYSSDSGFGEDSSLPVDAILNLIGPPFGRGGPPDAGIEFFVSPMRAMQGDRTTQTDDRRGGAPERLIRFEPFHYADGRGTWQITAKHKSGSVEAAVSGLRRRNLMASFCVLGVLAVTMGLILMASQRARRLARLQMDFVAGISHELRTPLAVISSAGENIAHGVVEDKQQLVRYGNSIVKQTRQLTQLVEQVLFFAASQKSERQYGLGPVNISEVVDAALEGTSGTVAAAGFTVERQVEAGLQPVNADFIALVRSLQNLITNAVKYGGESRWLRVAAASVKDKGRMGEIELTVEDRGIGIGKDEIKHVFEPFYRSPAVNESGIHGTGLGLPLARTIVEAMGGRLTARSELGKGSSFVIHLPAVEARKLAEAQSAANKPAADKPAGAEPGFSS
jgi:signal transduction histidine kinase